jgi:hypothetical protein
VVYETFCKNLFEKTTKAICSGLKESIGIIKFKIGDLEMASSKDYLQFVLEQLSELQEITYRAIMGEFIIYYRGKIVGGIYDDRLLVKPTKSAISYMPTVFINTIHLRREMPLKLRGGRLGLGRG